MATDGTSRWRWAFRLVLLVLLVLPVVTEWIGAGAEVLPAVDSATLIRMAGLGVVVLVVVLFVRQKRRSRGQRASETAPEHEDDRQVEGTGEVYAPYAYNNQQQARRESQQIRNRAEEIAENDREARDRR